MWQTKTLWLSYFLSYVFTHCITGQNISNLWSCWPFIYCKYCQNQATKLLLEKTISSVRAKLTLPDKTVISCDDVDYLSIVSLCINVSIFLFLLPGGNAPWCTGLGLFAYHFSRDYKHFYRNKLFSWEVVWYKVRINIIIIIIIMCVLYGYEIHVFRCRHKSGIQDINMVLTMKLY